MLIMVRERVLKILLVLVQYVCSMVGVHSMESSCFHNEKSRV